MDTPTSSTFNAVRRDRSKSWRALIAAPAVTAFASLAASLPALADTAGGSTIEERVQLNGSVARSSASALRVTQSISQALATAGPLAPQDALTADRTQSARQTMLWADHKASGLGVGIGVEQRRVYGGAAGASLRQSQPQMEGGMLIGASLATGPRSHLVVQTPVMTPAVNRNPVVADGPQFAEDQQRQIRMGLVFNTKKPLADLRQGFRMELSGQTTLAVKPRGGRIGFALQKIW